MPKLSFLAAASIMLAAGAAHAETQSERDARRASYIVGVSCNVLWGGQPGKIEFFEGGRGELSHHEGGVDFTWSVKKDEYCLKFDGRSAKCSTWPSHDIGDEETKVVSAVTGECF